MTNPFYNAMVGKTAPQPQMSIFEAAQQFKKNPLGFLLHTKYNIPTSIMNDPSAMLNYVIQTKQVSQAQTNTGQALFNQIQNGGLVNYGR